MCDLKKKKPEGAVARAGLGFGATVGADELECVCCVAESERGGIGAGLETFLGAAMGAVAGALYSK